MPEIRIIGGELTGRTGGLPSGVMAAAALQLSSAGPCPVCGTPDGNCTGSDPVTFIDHTADPLVVMLREVEVIEVAPGEKRPRTWSLGGPGARIRRSMALAYAPEDSWMEIKDASEVDTGDAAP